MSDGKKTVPEQGEPEAPEKMPTTVAELVAFNKEHGIEMKAMKFSVSKVDNGFVCNMGAVNEHNAEVEQNIIIKAMPEMPKVELA